MSQHLQEPPSGEQASLLSGRPQTLPRPRGQVCCEFARELLTTVEPSLLPLSLHVLQPRGLATGELIRGPVSGI